RRPPEGSYRSRQRHPFPNARGGKQDPEDGALTGRGVELDAAAERPHGLPDDREAEAEAVGVALAAVEAVEDVALHLGLDPRPGVLHLDRDGVRAAVRAEHDGAARRVLRRVLAEIAERLLEQVAVRLDRKPVGHLDVNGDARMRLEPRSHLA